MDISIKIVKNGLNSQYKVASVEDIRLNHLQGASLQYWNVHTQKS